MKKRYVAAVAALIALFAISALDSYTFAQAKIAVQRFCREHGGARSHGELPSGSSILLDLKDGFGNPMPGCPDCANNVSDPRNIAMVVRDWENTPYTTTWSPVTGIPMMESWPRGEDWGDTGWYKFSLIREGEACSGRRLEFHVIVDEMRPGPSDYKRVELCREPFDPRNADFAAGAIKFPELYDQHRWWMPPFTYRSYGLTRLRDGKRFMTITIAGVNASWAERLLSPWGSDDRFENGCRPPEINERWDLYGRNPVIFEGARVEFD